MSEQWNENAEIPVGPKRIKLSNCPWVKLLLVNPQANKSTEIDAKLLRDEPQEGKQVYELAMPHAAAMELRANFATSPSLLVRRNPEGWDAWGAPCRVHAIKTIDGEPASRVWLVHEPMLAAYFR